MIDIAARASARVARRIALVNDYYAPQTPLSEVREMQLERYMEHYQQFGHLAPHEGCTHQVCLEASQMISGAMQMYVQMQQQQQQPEGATNG